MALDEHQFGAADELRVGGKDPVFTAQLGIFRELAERSVQPAIEPKARPKSGTTLAEGPSPGSLQAQAETAGEFAARVPRTARGSKVQVRSHADSERADGERGGADVGEACGPRGSHRALRDRRRSANLGSHNGRPRRLSFPSPEYRSPSLRRARRDRSRRPSKRAGSIARSLRCRVSSSARAARLAHVAAGSARS